MEWSPRGGAVPEAPNFMLFNLLSQPQRPLAQNSLMISSFFEFDCPFIERTVDFRGKI